VALRATSLQAWRSEVKQLAIALFLRMIVFLQAARIEIVDFDPYPSSYPLAVALKDTPPGVPIGAKEYYAFS